MGDQVIARPERSVVTDAAISAALIAVFAIVQVLVDWHIIRGELYRRMSPDGALPWQLLLAAAVAAAYTVRGRDLVRRLVPAAIMFVVGVIGIEWSRHLPEFSVHHGFHLTNALDWVWGFVVAVTAAFAWGLARRRTWRWLLGLPVAGLGYVVCHYLDSHLASHLLGRHWLFGWAAVGVVLVDLPPIAGVLAGWLLEDARPSPGHSQG